MAVQRLHGTDGIRGIIATCDPDENPIEKLILQREISPSLMRLIGSATGTILAESKDSPSVVIGWDRRDGNVELVDSLEEGLIDSGCVVTRVGLVPTPGLHNALLTLEADAGMMVTASHNPATDSGVKLFDGLGYKSMPKLEDRISEVAWTPSPLDSNQGSKGTDYDGISGYRKRLKEWVDLLCELFGIDTEDWRSIAAPQGILLDSSGGATTNWMAFGITRRGLECEEVSDTDRELNDGCGAGELSPTDCWTVSELMEEDFEHALLSAIQERLHENDGMPPWSEGDLVAAALDGDGDRCLLIEATVDGLAVVDGDTMAYEWSQALLQTEVDELTTAYSIESDLSLPAALDRLGTKGIQTAVGDRWLAEALISSIGIGETIPGVVGCEDSGHLVLPCPHPVKVSHWGLVGDGAATLLAILSARAALGESRQILRAGWKNRKSVTDVDRSLWNGRNALAEEVEDMVRTMLSGHLLDRTEISGESNLLLLEGTGPKGRVSVGIRNSGTQAKTTVSLRSEGENLDELMDALVILLTERLVVKG